MSTGTRSDLVVNSPEWLAARRERLGSSPSEVSCALQIPGGFGSPAELYAEKVLGRPRQGITPLTAAIGHAVESVIPELVADRFGELESGGWWRDDQTVLASSMDWRQTGSTRDPVETKSAYYMLGGKGYGSDSCNPAVSLQAMTQARLCGAPAAHVVCVVLGGYGPELRIYDLELTSARERLVDGVREAADAWWHRHVVPKLPPPDADPVLWAQSAMARDEVEPVVATDEHRLLAAELQQLAAVLKPAQKRTKEIRRALAAAAQGAPLEGDGWAFRPSSRGAYRLSGTPTPVPEGETP